MSFERTKGSILNLSGGRVSADDLLDMLVCVSRDVFEINGITGSDELQVNDQSLLLKKLYNLVKMMLVIYNKNEAGVEQFSQRIREDYGKSVAGLAQLEQELTGLVAEIKKEEQKREQLQATAAEVEARRGHLLTVKADCDALQSRIDLLNDPTLDAMAEQKAALEAELVQRQNRAEGLEADKARLTGQLQQLETRLAQLQSALAELQSRVDTLTAREAEAVAEKTRLEESIRQISARVEQAKERIGQLPEQNQQLQAQLEELELQLTVLCNSLGSLKTDAFLQETLLSQPGVRKLLEAEGHPDLELAERKLENWEQLEQWFGEMEGRINGLSQVLQQLVARLVQEAEKLTAEKEQK